MNWIKIRKWLAQHKKKIIIFSSLIFGFFLLLTIFTYVVEVNSPFIKKIQSIFPMPAAIVGSSWVTINELERNVDSVQRFYENQNFSEIGIRIDFNTEDGKKRLNLRRREVLNKMIEDEIIEKLAKDYDIVVSDELIEAEINRPLAEGGNRKQKEKELEKLYGWTLDDFGEKVVRVELLQEKVEERFRQDNPITEKMRERANQVVSELNDGRDFGSVAQKYSEGSTKEQGGALGWFKSGQLVDSVNQVVFASELNKHSEIIESPFGLHIIKVTDSRTTQDGVKIVYVNQIIIKKKTFVEFVEEKMADTWINIPLIGYRWDKSINNVNFTSKEMKDFQEQIKQEADDMLRDRIDKQNIEDMK